MLRSARRACPRLELGACLEARTLAPWIPYFISLRRQLVADRQAADALAGRGEDSIAQRRCEGWKPRLADPARRNVDSIRYDVHIRHRRRLVDPQHPIAIVVALFDATLLEGDLAIKRKAHPHHRRAFDLRANALGIGGEAAIDRRVDARDRQMALVVHDCLDDGRD